MSNKVYHIDFIKIPSLFRLPFVDRSHIPITIGTLNEGYEEVLHVFRENFKYGYEPEGCNFAAYVDGELVVDLWGGYADKTCDWRWDESTVATFFSCTKALTAITVAMLVDRGQLQYSDTIAQYWPEFACEGKEQITVQQVLQHEGGLPYFRNKDETVESYGMQVLSDMRELDKLVESQKLHFPPGERSVYHPITFGWIMDGLVRRVDHKKRSVGEFFKEEISENHGLCDIRVGGTRDIEFRLARVQAHFRNSLMATLEYFCNPIKLTKASVNYYRNTSIFRRALFNINGARDFEVFNHPGFRSIGQPAVNGIGRARDLAKVLDMFEGGNFCSMTLLDKLRVPTIFNQMDSLFGVELSKGHGFIYTRSPLGDWQYGHPGVGGQFVKTDTKKRITFTYLSNGMKAGQGNDSIIMRRLEAALYKSYQKIQHEKGVEKVEI